MVARLDLVVSVFSPCFIKDHQGSPVTLVCFDLLGVDTEVLLLGATDKSRNTPRRDHFPLTLQTHTDTGSGGCEFDTRPGQTRDCKNGLHCISAWPQYWGGIRGWISQRFPGAVALLPADTQRMMGLM